MINQILVESNIVGVKNYMTDELNESLGVNERNFYISGVFTVSEQYNRNRRIYPHGICQSAISKYNEEYVQTKTAYGEIMHPESLTVDLSKSAILVQKYELESPNSHVFVGKAKVLSTPQGLIIQALIRDGGAFGVSTRGEGAVEQLSEGFRVAGWDIMAVDVVGTPSVREAMMGQLIENKLNELYTKNQINGYKQTADTIITSTFDKIERDRKFKELWNKMILEVTQNK
jgi:hypothetical protein